MGSWLVSHILQSYFFCVQQKKEIHIGLEQFELIMIFIFGWTNPLTCTHCKDTGYCTYHTCLQHKKTQTCWDIECCSRNIDDTETSGHLSWIKTRPVCPEETYHPLKNSIDTTLKRNQKPLIKNKINKNHWHEMKTLP